MHACIFSDMYVLYFVRHAVGLRGGFELWTAFTLSRLAGCGARESANHKLAIANKAFVHILALTVQKAGIAHEVIERLPLSAQQTVDTQVCDCVRAYVCMVSMCARFFAFLCGAHSNACVYIFGHVRAEFRATRCGRARRV